MSAERTEMQESTGKKVDACSACAKPLPDGATRCPNCAVPVGDRDRCVHCGANVDVEADPIARFVCRLCGGVRVPIDDARIARAADLVAALQGATVARTATSIWRAVAIAAAAFGCVSAAILTLVVGVAHPAGLATFVGSLAAAVPIALAGFALTQSRARQGEIAVHVEKAWFAAAREIARGKGGEIDARTLAKMTRISEGEADVLLGKMSTESRLVSTVTADGGLRYALEKGGSPDAPSLPSAP